MHEHGPECEEQNLICETILIPAIRSAVTQGLDAQHLLSFLVVQGAILAAERAYRNGLIGTPEETEGLSEVAAAWQFGYETTIARLAAPAEGETAQ